jgi:nicotinamide riboside transporter PnuC
MGKLESASSVRQRRAIRWGRVIFASLLGYATFNIIVFYLTLKTGLPAPEFLYANGYRASVLFVSALAAIALDRFVDNGYLYILSEIASIVIFFAAIVSIVIVLR